MPSVRIADSSSSSSGLNTSQSRTGNQTGAAATAAGTSASNRSSSEIKYTLSPTLDLDEQDHNANPATKAIASAVSTHDRAYDEHKSPPRNRIDNNAAVASNEAASGAGAGGAASASPEPSRRLSAAECFEQAALQAQQHKQQQQQQMMSLDIDASATQTSTERRLTESMNRNCNPDHPQLKRVLDWRHLIFLGVGSTIGAGIFVVTGVVARNITGPALFLSYIIAGIACMFAALSYSELAAMAPSAGSAYAYSRLAFGEWAAMIVGWDLCLEYGVSSASVAQAWSQYFQTILKLMHIHFPAALSQPPWHVVDGSPQSTGAVFDLLACCITLLITAIIVRGMRESARINAALVTLKVGVVLFVVLAGAAFIQRTNYSPFLPFGFFSLSFFGHTVVGQANAAGEATGVLAGSAIAFFSYIGFDSVSTLAEEVKRPKRDLPIGILGSLGISTVLYCSVSIVLVGMVPRADIDIKAPISSAFAAVGQQWAEGIIAVGAIVGLTSVLMAGILGQPRLLLAMSRDHLLPRVFRDIHPVHRTPAKNAMMCGVLISLLSSLIPLSILVELVSIGTLFAFCMVQMSLIRLRRTAPDAHRPFLCPWVPFVPALGILLCLVMMLSLPVTNWYRLLVWMALGLLIYFGWSRKNARLMRQFERDDLNLNAAAVSQQHRASLESDDGTTATTEACTRHQSPRHQTQHATGATAIRNSSSAESSNEITRASSLATTRRGSMDPMLPAGHAESSDVIELTTPLVTGINRPTGSPLAQQPQQSQSLRSDANAVSSRRTNSPTKQSKPRASPLRLDSVNPSHEGLQQLQPSRQQQQRELSRDDSALNVSDHFAANHAAAQLSPITHLHSNSPL